MPVSIIPYQKKEENKESDLDKVIKGLGIARDAFGIYGTYKNIEAAKNQQELAKQNHQIEEGKAKAAGIVPVLDPTGKITGYEESAERKAYRQQTEAAGLAKLLAETEKTRAETDYTKSGKGQDSDLKSLRRELIVSQINANNDKIGAKKEEKINAAAERLSSKLSGAGEINSALSSVEKKLGFSLDDYKDGSKIDLPGMSVPGVGRVSFYDTAARQLNGAMAKVFNTELKDRSGAAVTSNELERLKTEFGEGKFNTEEEMIGALRDYKNAFRDLVKNTEAGFAPEAVSTVEGRGGFSSRSIGRGGDLQAGKQAAPVWDNRGLSLPGESPMANAVGEIQVPKEVQAAAQQQLIKRRGLGAVKLPGK